MRRPDTCTAVSIGERLRADSIALAKEMHVPRQEAQRDVQILLARALDWDLAWLLAHTEDQLEPAAVQRYDAMLTRRLAHEPVAYILGEREFYSLMFEVNASVLIPRPDTELLVDVALACIPESASCDVLDLGTGSGCVAVTLAKLRPNARVLATDLSEAALEVLTRNALRHAVTNLESARGSWFETVGKRQFDIIVSNPPYVGANDPHLDRGDLRFEPRLALVAGTDGLSALREIAARSPGHLRPRGWLLLEHGHDQAEAVAGLLAAAGFEGYLLHRDLAGIPRVARARLP